MVKKITLLNFMGLALALHQCTSPLSDVGITDPSLIKVNIELKRTPSSNSIEAAIYDKNSSFVELRDGSIAINGVPMEVKHAVVGGHPYYQIPTNQVFVDTNTHYTCTIQLSDSSTYQATIVSQKNKIRPSGFISSHKRSESLTIGYSGLEETDENNITITKVFDTDTGTYTSYSIRHLSASDNGQLTFSPGFFENNLIKVSFTVTSKRYGTIASEFRKGSSIVSEFSRKDVIAVID